MGDELKKEVLELERQRIRAAIDKDLDTLRKLYHPELVYQHSTGAKDTFESYLGLIEQGTLDYRNVEVIDPQIIAEGGTVVIYAVQKGDAVVAGAPRKLHGLSISVWVKGEAGWQLLAFQSAPPPQA